MDKQKLSTKLEYEFNVKKLDENLSDDLDFVVDFKNILKKKDIIKIKVLKKKRIGKNGSLQLF